MRKWGRWLSRYVANASVGVAVIAAFVYVILALTVV